MQKSLADELFKSPFQQRKIGRILSDVAQGLTFLHSKNMHHDLKSANILSSSEGVFKIADFGIATQTDDCNKTAVGSPDYMAPEVKNRSYSTPVDVWSFGTIAYEMIYAKDPYTTREKRAFQELVTKLQHHKEPKGRLQLVLWSTLKLDPSLRCSAAHLVNLLFMYSPVQPIQEQ